LAQPLLLAPRSLLGPNVKPKIASGIEPILPLIDIEQTGRRGATTRIPSNWVIHLNASI
jgi:hypothetical protein